MSKQRIGLFLILIIIGSPGNLMAQESDAADPKLIAVGTLSASNLYLSHLVLSTVADGFVNGNYDLEITKNITGETIFLNENSRSSLQALLEDDTIAQEDRDIVREMIESYQVLDNMARALITFVEEDDDGSSYRLLREEAWEQILSLLKM